MHMFIMLMYPGHSFLCERVASKDYRTSEVGQAVPCQNGVSQSTTVSVLYAGCVHWQPIAILGQAIFGFVYCSASAQLHSQISFCGVSSYMPY